VLRHPFNRLTCDAPPIDVTENKWTLDLFKQMSSAYPTLTVLNPKSIQCRDGKCTTEINGLGIYRDVGHITDYASYVFGERYLNQIGNPLN